MDFTIPILIKCSLSFASDHLVKGNPRSLGGARATCMMSARTSLRELDWPSAPWTLIKKGDAFFIETPDQFPDILGMHQRLKSDLFDGV
ncbi:MAG TPA: hypothetical protein VK470_08475 [Bacteroidota bacterium]|nr:hypothetical protein [Bacteroidota bacterium]